MVNIFRRLWSKKEIHDEIHKESTKLYLHQIEDENDNVIRFTSTKSSPISLTELNFREMISPSFYYDSEGDSSAILYYSSGNNTLGTVLYYSSANEGVQSVDLSSIPVSSYTVTPL